MQNNDGKNDVSEMEIMECDVVIVGAGPAGLSAAIRLAQNAKAAGEELSIIVVEKGSEVGAHILSGAVLEPRALNELLPDWKERGAPLETAVTKDRFAFMTQRKLITLPTPPQMHNAGNYIISLANFVRWLGTQAEALGVQIFPGFPAADVIIEDGTVKGIVTGSFGIGKDGKPKPSFQAGMQLRAAYTLFAEGCRGSLAQRLMDQFQLRQGVNPQTYAIGLKELWEIDPAQHHAGEVLHTIGWPTPRDTYAGSFVYHMAQNQLSIGYVVGLDYRNPHLDPYMEFQTFKTHPHIRRLLEGGRRIAYGARALNEGGWQSIPQLAFPGGALIGCAAGFLNVAKIKGTHTAMKSGMLAADALMQARQNQQTSAVLTNYEPSIKASWVGQELQQVRNIRPAFRAGLWAGLAYAALDTYVLRGKAPWTFQHHADHTTLRLAAECQAPHYERPDGKVSFTKLDSVALTATNHEEDQPCHLQLKDASVPISYNLPRYDAPEQRYCPAGVYEIVEDSGAKRLQINAQNCIHCKTCDIKDPTQNIVWVTPEGCGGPNYPNM
ncbi:MAG: electron transfer flavoprotein-ubiquinone oxidoreductase [Rickettsiales bacterium]|nr:electron transfer flavoprotein-ubiquinone oxidoreductase [Rickettsiales bacterium]